MKKPGDLQGVILFIVIAFVYSWSLFFVVDVWLLPVLSRQGNLAAIRLLSMFGHMLAMAGPAIAAFSLYRFFHKVPFPTWKWSRPTYYILAALAMVAIWTLPALVGLAFNDAFGILSPIDVSAWTVVIASLTLGWVAGMAEEAGWCAYLLPRLAPRIGKTRALIVSGAIRGLWHWPVLLAPALARVIAEDISTGRFLLLAVGIAIQLLVSNILFGSLFGWVWYRTESLPLLGWLHQWYNAARDITSLIILGYVGSVWFVLWTIPFNVVAFLLLFQVAQGEGVRLWSLAPDSRGNEPDTV
jgi:membrane protease YdiL (CAAX protease family)